MLVRLTLVNRDEQHDHGLPTGSQLGGVLGASQHMARSEGLSKRIYNNQVLYHE